VADDIRSGLEKTIFLAYLMEAAVFFLVVKRCVRKLNDFGPKFLPQAKDLGLLGWFI
jgi:hypothetical protein